MQRREGAFLQTPGLPSHFWLLLLPFCFKHFLLASSSFQAKKRKNKEKKTIEKKINAKKGRSFPLSSRFALSLLALAFALLFQTFSLGIFFFSSKRKKKTKKKKHIEKKKNAEKGGSFPSNSHSALSLLAPASTSHSTLLFQMLSPSIFFFLSTRKLKKQRK